MPCWNDSGSEAQTNKMAAALHRSCQDGRAKIASSHRSSAEGVSVRTTALTQFRPFFQCACARQAREMQPTRRRIIDRGHLLVRSRVKSPSQQPRETRRHHYPYWLTFIVLVTHYYETIYRFSQFLLKSPLPTTNWSGFRKIPFGTGLWSVTGLSEGCDIEMSLCIVTHLT